MDDLRIGEVAPQPSSGLRIHKPHLPWYVPQKYCDMHPLQGIILPDTLDNDRDDLPAWGKKPVIEVYNVSGA